MFVKDFRNPINNSSKIHTPVFIQKLRRFIRVKNFFVDGTRRRTCYAKSGVECTSALNTGQ